VNRMSCNLSATPDLRAGCSHVRIVLTLCGTGDASFGRFTTTPAFSPVTVRYALQVHKRCWFFYGFPPGAPGWVA